MRNWLLFWIFMAIVVLTCEASMITSQVRRIADKTAIQCRCAPANGETP